MQDPTLDSSDNLSNIPPRSKPGRKVGEMGYGNVSGKAQKGIYLSRIYSDMLEQLVIVTGGTQSSHVETAIRNYFLKIKAEFEAGNFKWNQVLESKNYVLPKWQR